MADNNATKTSATKKKTVKSRIRNRKIIRQLVEEIDNELKDFIILYSHRKNAIMTQKRKPLQNTIKKTLREFQKNLVNINNSMVSKKKDKGFYLMDSKELAHQKNLKEKKKNLKKVTIKIKLKN